jgi:hypothetical protein
MLHTHKFKGVTEYSDGHLHLFSGISSASTEEPGHTHIIAGDTTMADGHSHRYSIRTQPPTYVDAGGYKHYHYFTGRTYNVQNHTHGMESTTFVLGE